MIYKVESTPELVDSNIVHPGDGWGYISYGSYYTFNAERSNGIGVFLSKYPVYGLGFQRSGVGEEWMMFE